MFRDSHNFKIVDDEDGRRYAFHYRDLGMKSDEMYPEKKWADVVINDVPVDITMDLQDRDEFLHIIGEASSYRETTLSEPNEKSVPQGIVSSGEENPYGGRNKKETREKTSVRWKKGVKRERTIPPSKKKYPTKPKKKREDKFVKKRGMKKSSEKEYFEYEIKDESIPLEKVYRGITCEACL